VTGRSTLRLLIRTRIYPDKRLIIRIAGQQYARTIIANHTQAGIRLATLERCLLNVSYIKLLMETEKTQATPNHPSHL